MWKSADYWKFGLGAVVVAALLNPMSPASLTLHPELTQANDSLSYILNYH